jgi:proteic killer suppression protein
LSRLYAQDDTRGVRAAHAEKLRQILTLLEDAEGPANLGLPGLRLHPLKGSRRGQWAVWVTGNWRVVFRFEGRNVTDVDLVDYH